MFDIRQLHSNRLSTYRTWHHFAHFGEFTGVGEFLAYRHWADEHGIPLLILGNGSNVLFTRKQIHTLVLRNKLKPWMRDLGDRRLEVSSSLSLMKILQHCQDQGLDSFYYLAIAPATVGGAIAMNAGKAHNTIFEFVESVTFLEGDVMRTLANEQIERKHRHTMFTGVQDRLIVSVIFRFHENAFEPNAIGKRIEWCQANQDLTAPNCGSVFRDYNRPIYRWMRRLFPLRIWTPFFRTQFSKIVNNWIICRNRSSWPIVFLIRSVQGIHRIMGKKAVLELIEVD